MSKYKHMVQTMLDEQKELFETFRQIHDAYTVNPQINQEKFNSIGREVEDMMRVYEKRLCANMQTGKYGLFSESVSRKFRDELALIFPKINFIGIHE